MLNIHRLPAAITYHVVYSNLKLTSSSTHLHITFHLMGASELDTVVSVSAVALAPTDRSKQYPRQTLQRLNFHPVFFNLQPVGQLGSTSGIHTVCERESHTLVLNFFFPAITIQSLGHHLPLLLVFVYLQVSSVIGTYVSTLEEYVVRIQQSCTSTDL